MDEPLLETRRLQAVQTRLRDLTVEVDLRVVVDGEPGDAALDRLLDDAGAYGEDAAYWTLVAQTSASRAVGVVEGVLDREELDDELRGDLVDLLELALLTDCYLPEGADGMPDVQVLTARFAAARDGDRAARRALVAPAVGLVVNTIAVCNADGVAELILGGDAPAA